MSDKKIEKALDQHKVEEYIAITDGIDFIIRVYSEFLNRDPDFSGFFYYYSLLNGGSPRELILYQIAFSSENNLKLKLPIISKLKYFIYKNIPLRFILKNTIFKGKNTTIDSNKMLQKFSMVEKSINYEPKNKGLLIPKIRNNIVDTLISLDECNKRGSIIKISSLWLNKKLDDSLFLYVMVSLERLLGVFETFRLVRKCGGIEHRSYAVLEHITKMAIDSDNTLEAVSLINLLFNKFSLENTEAKKLLVRKFFAIYSMGRYHDAEELLFEIKNYDQAFYLEWSSIIRLEKFDIESAKISIDQFQNKYPEFDQTIHRLEEGILEAKEFVDNCDSKKLPRNKNFGPSKIVIDITSLYYAVISNRSLGAIERSIAYLGWYLVHFTDLNFCFIAWKGFSAIVVDKQKFLSVCFNELCEDNNSKTEYKEPSYIPCVDDVCLMMGSTWHYDVANYKVQKLKNSGVKIVYYIHDLLQISYPDAASVKWREIFSLWINGLSDADLVLANSLHTCSEVSDYIKQNNIQLNSTVKMVELGNNPFAIKSKYSNPSDLPFFIENFEYILYVSSFSKRKNHLFLLNAWLSIYQDIGDEGCPELILVGPRGDAFDDLVIFLESHEEIRSKVHIFENVSDVDLDSLYKSCLFTVFVSSCEGWGMPVAESLRYGKICVAANNTAIAEVGKIFSDLFQDGDSQEFIKTCKHYIFDKKSRMQKENFIVKNYVVRKWEDFSIEIVKSLQRLHLESSDKNVKPLNKGVVIVCPSMQQNCGIASYTQYIATELRNVGIPVLCVKKSCDAITALESGIFENIIIQHEYGLFDCFNSELGQGETTGELCLTLDAIADRFGISPMVVMHTIDMGNPVLARNTYRIINTKSVIYSLTSRAIKQGWNIHYLEHGVPTHLIESKKISIEYFGALTVGSFGFMSKMKRPKKMMADISEVGGRLLAAFTCNDSDKTMLENLSSDFDLDAHITYEFLSDSQIIAMLNSCDISYFPQCSVSYYATSGSARMACVTNSIVVVAPSRQFYDMSEGVIFSDDLRLPTRLIEEIGMDVILNRQHKFSEINSIGSIYSNALKRGPAQFKAKEFVSISSLLLMGQGLFDVHLSSNCHEVYNILIERLPDFSTLSLNDKLEFINTFNFFEFESRVVYITKHHFSDIECLLGRDAVPLSKLLSINAYLRPLLLLDLSDVDLVYEKYTRLLDLLSDNNLCVSNFVMEVPIDRDISYSYYETIKSAVDSFFSVNTLTGDNIALAWYSELKERYPFLFIR